MLRLNQSRWTCIAKDSRPRIRGYLVVLHTNFEGRRGSEKYGGVSAAR